MRKNLFLLSSISLFLLSSCYSFTQHISNFGKSAEINSYKIAEKPLKEEWREVKSLKGHISDVNSLSFSKDGKLLVSTSRDKTVKVWDVNSATLQNDFIGHSAWSISAVFEENTKNILSYGADGIVKVWDMKSGKEKTEYKDFPMLLMEYMFNNILPVNFSSNGKYFTHVYCKNTKGISNCKDNNIDVYNSSGKQINKLSGHKDFVSMVSLSNDGKYTATASCKEFNFFGGCSNSGIKIWDTNTGKEIHELIEKGRIMALGSFSSDNKYFAETSFERVLQTWDLNTGKNAEQMIFASGNSIPSVIVYNPKINKEIASLRLTVASVSFAGTLPLAEKNVQIWDMNTGKLKSSFVVKVARDNSIAYSPDGNFIAVGACSQTRTDESGDIPLVECADPSIKIFKRVVN